MEQMLSSSKVAKVLNIHINTLRRWSNTGIIKCYRIGPRKDRRFSKEDVETYLKASKGLGNAL